MALITKQIFYSIVLTILLIPYVSAFDGGDAAAMVIGLFISVLGVCSCFGWYARKRSVV